MDGCVLRKEVTGYIEKLDLLDLNYALYRCDKEEREDGNGGGAYEVPGAGRLVYCGLQGIISVISKVSCQVAMQGLFLAGLNDGTCF